MKGCLEILVLVEPGFERFKIGVGVAEGLGGGLQRRFCCGYPFMPVRVRSPTPKVFLGNNDLCWD